MPILSATTVFEGRRFQVQRREVIISGEAHTYDIVMHPGAAIILPILDDGRVVLINNYREAVKQELLELPAGTLDDGEDPAGCAARELTEETGYTAGNIVPLLDFYSTPGILNEHMYTFLATNLTPGPTAHEAGEQITVVPMPYKQAIDAVRDGRIIDAKTILALLYYDHFISGQGTTA